LTKVYDGVTLPHVEQTLEPEQRPLG